MNIVVSCKWERSAFNSLWAAHIPIAKKKYFFLLFKSIIMISFNHYNMLQSEEEQRK